MRPTGFRALGNILYWGYIGVIWYFPKIGGPQYRPPNTIMLIMGTPKKVHLIWGNPYIGIMEIKMETATLSGLGSPLLFRVGDPEFWI